MDNLDYLLGRVSQVPTGSSVLTSTSKYLNHAGLRDWVATHFLRKNGPDRGNEGDTADGLITAMAQLTDADAVEALIERERDINPAFRAWVDQAYIGPHSVAFFAEYAPGTVGGIYHDCLVNHGFQVNLGRASLKHTSRYEFIRFRMGQIHDFEHIITGGGFNTLGELLPYFVRLSNVHRHLSPELAGELTKFYILGGYRFPVRAGLHYPQVYLTVLDILQRGIRIGLESDAIFMARFEDVLHLTAVEARVALGVKHAEDLDTVEASRIFDDRGDA
ncbi:MAG: Coq4 family protein [Pseudomonadota bacterium]